MLELRLVGIMFTQLGILVMPFVVQQSSLLLGHIVSRSLLIFQTIYIDQGFLPRALCK